MNKEEFKNFLIQRAAENDFHIEEDVIDEFYLYMRNLIEWNQKINLTAIKDEREIVIKHFIDSILVNKFHTRAEDLAHESEYREQFDTVVSRAVANMTTLVEYMIPFVRVGGKCLCLKGPNCEDEINSAKNAIRKLGGKIEEVIEYKIDNNDRCLVVINKIRNTEQIYPRKLGKPLKEPLQ